VYIPTDCAYRVIPSSHDRTWNGFTFTVPLPAPAASTDSYIWHNFTLPDQTSTTQLDFEADILDLTNPNASSFFLIKNVTAPLNLSDVGALSFTAVASPEPSSVALMLAGIGFLLAMRKRLAQGHQQAA
jgi:hypothetical protein